MKCNAKEHHNHLSEEQLDSMIKSAIKDHVKIMRMVQEILYKGKVCESDFLSILMNIAVHIGSEAILHIERASTMQRQEIIDSIMGGIAKRAGADYISIHVPHETSAGKTAH